MFDFLKSIDYFQGVRTSLCSLFFKICFLDSFLNPSKGFSQLYNSLIEVYYFQVDLLFILCNLFIKINQIHTLSEICSDRSLTVSQSLNCLLLLLKHSVDTLDLYWQLLLKVIFDPCEFRFMFFQFFQDSFFKSDYFRHFYFIKINYLLR